MKVKFMSRLKDFFARIRTRAAEVFEKGRNRTRLRLEGSVRKLRELRGKIEGRSISDFSFLKARWAKGVFFLIVGIPVLALFVLLNQTSAVQGSLPTYTVQKGPFEMKIRERGTIKALRNVMISSQLITEQGKIIRLIPEGTYVKEGDLLVEFDKSVFLEKIDRYETDLVHSRAELIQSREDLKASQARVEQTVKKARDEIILAELNLKDLNEGSGPLRVERAKFDVDRARARYEKLKRDFAEFTELVKEGYVSQAEVDAIGQSMQEEKTQYEFSEAEYNTLVKFTYPSQLESAKARLRAAKDSVEKLRETSSYNLASAEAGVQRAKGMIQSKELKLKQTREDLEKTDVRAPIEGFVVYPDLFFRGSSDRRKVEVGDVVLNTQNVIQIPDTSKMLVDTRIREVDIYKVQPEQEVDIRVDAYPDLVLAGKVSQIGTLAVEDNAGGTGGKFFNLQVLLKDADQRLRPGMTARVEVLVDSLPEALLVPVEAVFEKGDQTVSYVLKRGKIMERVIEPGKSNEDFIVIRSGLADGERVLLLDPTHDKERFEKKLVLSSSR